MGRISMCMEQLQIARAGPMATAVLRARGALGLSLRLPGVPLSGLGFRVYGLGLSVPLRLLSRTI